MPSALFVCVSWISFVVPIDAIPGRMALLVTLLLVLINMFNSSVEKENNLSCDDEELPIEPRET